MSPACSSRHNAGQKQTLASSPHVENLPPLSSRRVPARCQGLPNNGNRKYIQDDVCPTSRQKNKTKKNKGGGGSFFQIPVKPPGPNTPPSPSPSTTGSPLKFNREEPVFMRCQRGIKGAYEWQRNHRNPLTPVDSPRISCFLQIFRPATLLTGRRDNTLGQPTAI